MIPLAAHAAGGATALPAALVPSALAAAVTTAYLVRFRTLARRGRPVPWWRAAAFLAGVAVLVAAVFPTGWRGEDDRLSGHVAQHLLIGDIGPLLMLAGLTGPLLRPVLAAVPHRISRGLAAPTVAGAAALGLMAVWHLPGPFAAALEHPGLHIAQHACLLTAGVFMWAPVLGTLPGPGWFGPLPRLGYHTVVRLVHVALGNVLVFAAAPVYPVYAHHGGDPLGDQRVAGALLLGEGMVMMVATGVLLGHAALRDAARRQRRAEAAVVAERPGGC